LNLHGVGIKKTRIPRINDNSVTFQLRSNYLSLPGNDGFDSRGDIFDGDADSPSGPAAVQSAYRQSA